MPAKKFEPRPSKTEKILVGTQPEGFSSPIASVWATGPRSRRIVLHDGSEHGVYHSTLLNLVIQQLSKTQKLEMKKTLKPNADGSVRMQIGGHVQGREKTYSTRQGAMKALNRRYGKDA